MSERDRAYYAKHKEAVKLRSRKYYETHRDIVKANSRKRNAAIYAERRELLNNIKARPCADCGVQYPSYVMQFDHLRDKVFTVSMSLLARSLPVLLAEIAKCEVVCANCHAERTHGRKANPAQQPEDIIHRTRLADCLTA